MYIEKKITDNILVEKTEKKKRMLRRDFTEIGSEGVERINPAQYSNKRRFVVKNILNLWDQKMRGVS